MASDMFELDLVKQLAQAQNDVRESYDRLGIYSDMEEFIQAIVLDKILGQPASATKASINAENFGEYIGCLLSVDTAMTKLQTLYGVYCSFLKTEGREEEIKESSFLSSLENLCSQNITASTHADVAAMSKHLIGYIQKKPSS